jgi:hypothetical protein
MPDFIIGDYETYKKAQRDELEFYMKALVNKYLKPSTAASSSQAQHPPESKSDSRIQAFKDKSLSSNAAASASLDALASEAAAIRDAAQAVSASAATRTAPSTPKWTSASAGSSYRQTKSQRLMRSRNRNDRRKQEAKPAETSELNDGKRGMTRS